ncbi:UPF0261 family protein [Klebsiella indica]|uniref:UPF0261 family protein n=1 Tax=Klebsiella indica TaxID=2582917 RepID=A0A5R9L8Y3_9ENTR|nr:Tm-1-like ATP-binding domain-containing protein [Klebsiella indica]TLV04891.1 UPF0261 family protein [Klebsiella indica]
MTPSTLTKAAWIATTADTKGRELQFVSGLIRSAGVPTKTVDLSTQPYTAPNLVDFTPMDIACHHPQGPDAVFCGDRGKAIEAMSVAFRCFLATRDDVGALLGLGGSGGTALITPAMQELAIGIPKLMVSTMASGDISGYIGASDIAMLYSVTDVAGINRISRKILTNAAAQIAGAMTFTHQDVVEDKPALALTMFGVTTPAVQQISTLLGEEYDSLVFHATGSGGNAMEKLARQGLLNGMMDITLTEICDLLFDGVLACSPERLDVVAQQSIPWIGSCGALDMVNFGAFEKIPEKYRQRQFVRHNAQVTLMRTTPEENTIMGRWIAEKLNRCQGEICFLIPLRGFSALDEEGQEFWSPAADQAFIESFEHYFQPSATRRVIKLDHHINSALFAAAAVHEMKTLLQTGTLYEK